MEQQDPQPETQEATEAEDHSLLEWGGEIGGAILLVISIIFIIGGLQLGLGSPFRLGTGAFPFITGLILAALATAICIQEWRNGDGLADEPDWVNFAAIIAALAVFAATADRLGLMPAVFLTILVASSTDRSLPLVGKAILGGIVAVGAWVLFIILLNLPFKAVVGF